MKKRVISGLVYVVVLLAFYLLKVMVPYGDIIFDVLIYGFALVGTLEMIRAMQDNLARTEKAIVFVFAIICVPACAIGEYCFGYGVHFTAICFFALVISLLSLLVFKHEESTLENIGASLVCAVYPALLICLLVLANHFGDTPLWGDKFISSSEDLQQMQFNSNLAIMFIFTISPVSDMVAFFFGMGLKKKFPKKLAPTISPNKTVIGFIGGLVGGAIGAVLIYFVYHAIFVNNAIFGNFVHMYIWLPIYIVIGVLASLATAFGDLVESAIKRHRGLKDMGDIMPGHGGILDRIDGTLFATVIVYAAFALVQMVAI
ncbi:MAG: phosphatidate cytidylyltransferase [Clostridia bacterium]|nr:phosphatidate cytidylyltransferase [Clostridia bacterium]